MPKINKAELATIVVPLPPLAEQKRIVAKLDELLPIVEQYGKAQRELDELNVALPARLRQSILQEAISGRLVPQDPNDEPASALLARIREEKARLVKEGKLKKKDLVETPIKEEEIPFEIPSSWEWVRIKDICSIVNGFTPRRTEPKFWTNGTINWFTVEDINKQGEVIRYTEQKITKVATSEDRIVRAGSVLLCCTASVGRCAITTVPVTTNQQFNALTVKEEFRKAVSDTYILTIAKTLAPTLHQLAGQTTFEFVSVTKVGNIVVPLPPLAEQKRIVAKLEELLPIVEQYGKAQKELDELNAALPARLRQSILQQAISGRLVPQDPNDEPADGLKKQLLQAVKNSPFKKKWNSEPIEEDELPFDIPDNWTWIRLGDIVYTQTGLSYSKGDLEKKVSNPIRVLRGGNIQSGSWCTKDDDVMIAPEFVKKDIFLKKNSFITPAVTSLEHLGKTALIREDHNDIVAGGFVLYLMPYDDKNNGFC